MSNGPPIFFSGPDFNSSARTADSDSTIAARPIPWITRILGSSRNGSPGTAPGGCIVTAEPTNFIRSPLLFVARVVGRVQVLDRPRPVAVELHHGLALDPDEVLHARGPRAVSAGGERLGLGRVELLAHAEVERPRNDRHALRLGVGVRRDPVAVGHFHPEHER